MVLQGGSVSILRPSSGALPRREELLARLADPALDQKARAVIAEPPSVRPLSLEEHGRTGRWLARRNQRSLRLSAWASTGAATILGAAILTWRFGGDFSQDKPIVAYHIPKSGTLSPHPAPKWQQVQLEVKRDAPLVFSIDPDSAPSHPLPVDAQIFIRPPDGSMYLADALLQPVRRAPTAASFFVDTPVEPLLQRGVLQAGDNSLVIVVGRPRTMPRTAEALEAILSGRKPWPSHAKSTFTLIDLTIHVAGNGS